MRIATFASSAFLLTTFTNSLRRSSVNCGIAKRIESPSLLGFNPKSDVKIAFSIAPIIVLSHGAIKIIRGSGADTLAT